MQETDSIGVVRVPCNLLRKIDLRHEMSLDGQSNLQGVDETGLGCDNTKHDTA